MFLQPTLAHFDSLPHLVRQRLVASLRGHASPLPTLVRSTAPRLPRAVLLGLAVVGLAVGFLARSPPAVRGAPLASLVGLVAASAAIVAIAALALRGHLAARRLPWPPGQYVLGAYLIDATGEVLRVESALAVVATDVVHHHVDGGHVVTSIELRTRDHRYAFAVDRRADAREALDRLEADLIALVDAVRSGDVETVARLDPLFEARLDEEPAATAPVRRPRDQPRLGRAPWSAAWVLGLSLVVGGVTGAGLWWRLSTVVAHLAR